MGFVIDPNKWRANSFKGLNCAIFPCYNRPTNQCPRCSLWSCYEHAKSHFHINTHKILKGEKKIQKN